MARDTTHPNQSAPGGQWLAKPETCSLPQLAATPGRCFVGLLLTLALTCLPTATSWAVQSTAAIAMDRPRIGLVLGGGGARGAAHIGVLRVLEELRVPIDYIAGTSMGSIVGGLYAAGQTPDQIEAALRGIDWNDVFRDRPPRKDISIRRKADDRSYLVDRELGFEGAQVKLPFGLIDGQKIDLVLQRLTLPVAQVQDFDRLPIPFRAIATDITSGGAVVLRSGNLAQAIRASMSVPAVFAPAEIDGRLLVDGGVANNVPVDVVRDMGADIVIAVSVGTPLNPREQLTSLLAITEQLTGLLTWRNTEVQLATLGERDILIEPQLGAFPSNDFAGAPEVIPMGFEAAQRQRTALARLGLSPTDYAVYRRIVPDSEVEEPPIIEFVRLDNRSALSDQVLRARLRVKLGEPLDVDALQQDLGRIYGLESFESVRYELVEEDGKTGLVIKAREKSWGPNYLKFGLALSSNFSGTSSFNLGASYRRPTLNRLGGEWRVAGQVGEEPVLAVDFYQPLQPGTGFFVSPALFIANRNVNFFEDGNRIAEFQVREAGVGLDLGYELGTFGEVRLGYRGAQGEAKLRTGEPALGDRDADRGELFVGYGHDTLDSLRFPSDGAFYSLQWVSSRTELGAEADYDLALANGLVAHSWGRDTLMLRSRLQTTVDGDPDLGGLFRAGGFLNISGLDPNELTGQHFAFFSAIYQRRIADWAFLPTYLGVSMELGNVWPDDVDWDDLLTAGAVYLGADTFVGPIYLGYGHASSGRDNIYLFLGRPF